MRTIKFRVWDKAEIEFADIFEYDSKYWFSRFRDNNIPKSLVIQQFTGILDRNEREIYEGDIVISSEEPGTFEIKWEDCSACFLVGNDLWPNADLTVIGNIFQNPELLK